MKNSYTYGAINRMEQAVDAAGQTAAYQYNGLGYRVGKTDPESRIHYTIDLTRQYHNLLQKEENGTEENYLWDGNVAGIMEGAYYLQDELGSPIRLTDEKGHLAESYGYDEFGCDLYGNQGQLQPFGYTGYQADRTAGTYFAQAREYRAELGRFAGRDIIKGNTAAPYAFNEYGYCWNNPMALVDLDGAWPQWMEDIGDGVKNVVSSVSETVTDVATNVVDTAKDFASDVKGAANEFYDAHKEVIDTIGKVTLTVAVGAAVVVGAVAVAAAAPAGIAASAAVALGAGIVSTGVVGGVIGGASNKMTGGSFLNGFCGGFANGCITAAGTALGNPAAGNLIGGFVGNEITENFNNMDIEDPNEQKGQLEISITSGAVGFVQLAVAAGPIGSLCEGAGIMSGSLTFYIAKVFGQDLNFMASNIAYLLTDGILKSLNGRKSESNLNCAE